MITEASEHYAESQEQACRSGVSVLVIDDDEDFRALAQMMLETAGFKASTATSVGDGVKHLLSHPTDVVILDIIMPDRDGIEGLGEIRRLFPATRIVTVSGDRNSELFLTVSAYLGAAASLDKSRIGSLCSLLRIVLESQT